MPGRQARPSAAARSWQSAGFTLTAEVSSPPHAHAFDPCRPHCDADRSSSRAAEAPRAAHASAAVRGRLVRDRQPAPRCRQPGGRGVRLHRAGTLADARADARRARRRAETGRGVQDRRRNDELVPARRRHQADRPGGRRGEDSRLRREVARPRGELRREGDRVRQPGRAQRARGLPAREGLGAIAGVPEDVRRRHPVARLRHGDWHRSAAQTGDEHHQLRRRGAQAGA